METKLFDRVKCKGFYKPHRDGLFIRLDETTLTADLVNANFASADNAGIVEKDIESAIKTYYKHVERNFSGVIVGFVDLAVTGFLDVIYQDPIHTGLGTIPERFYIAKIAKDVVKCVIVYYADNKKHYVPLEDIVEIIDRWDKNQKS